MLKSLADQILQGFFIIDLLYNTPMFNVTQSFHNIYPDAHAGILAMRNVDNQAAHPELEARKQALEIRLREQFTGQSKSAIEALPPIPAYTAYYKRFDKTYHVLQQIISIALKGKPIPSVSAVVEAMFMAEIKNGILTAGHDLDRLQLPVTLSVANGDETYTLMRGSEQTLKAGDMFMADGSGVISSILYGPDQRTQIHAGTKNVLFTVYAPVGVTVEAVESHLRDIQENINIVSPQADVELLQVLS